MCGLRKNDFGCGDDDDDDLQLDLGSFLESNGLPMKSKDVKEKFGHLEKGQTPPLLSFEWTPSPNF